MVSRLFPIRNRIWVTYWKKISQEYLIFHGISGKTKDPNSTYKNKKGWESWNYGFNGNHWSLGGLLIPCIAYGKHPLINIRLANDLKSSSSRTHLIFESYQVMTHCLCANVSHGLANFLWLLVFTHHFSFHPLGHQKKCNAFCFLYWHCYSTTFIKYNHTDP